MENNKIVYFDKTKYVIKKNSKREIDEENGFLRVSNNILTTACVSAYVGQEILNFDKFGINPNEVVKILRPVDELKKAVNSAKGLPLTNGHIYWDVNNPPESIGSVGTDVFFDENENAIIASLIFTKKNVIDMIMTEQVEGLSCGYSYVLKKESGEFNGEKYDYIMYDIVFNHVALVDDPRVERSKVADDASKINKILKGKRKMFNLYELFKMSKMSKAFAKDEDVKIEDIESAIFEALKDENSDGAQKHEIIKDLLEKLKGVLAKQNASDENLEEKEKEEAKDEDPEDKEIAKDEDTTVETGISNDEEISEEEKEKILDEDIELANDETIEEVVEKQKASDSKRTLMKLMNFNKAVKVANAVVGQIDERSFNYNPTKVLNYVLENKNVAFDSKTKFNDKLSLVTSLVKKDNQNFANDSKNNNVQNDLNSLLDKALKF